MYPLPVPSLVDWRSIVCGTFPFISSSFAIETDVSISTSLSTELAVELGGSCVQQIWRAPGYFRSDLQKCASKRGGAHCSLRISAQSCLLTPPPTLFTLTIWSKRFDTWFFSGFWQEETFWFWDYNLPAPSVVSCWQHQVSLCLKARERKGVALQALLDCKFPSPLGIASAVYGWWEL